MKQWCHAYVCMLSLSLSLSLSHTHTLSLSHTRVFGGGRRGGGVRLGFIRGTGVVITVVRKKVEREIEEEQQEEKGLI